MAAGIAYATVAVLFINLQPAVEGTLASAFGLNAAQVGMTAAIESGTSIFGGLLVARAIAPTRARLLVGLSIATFILANGLTASVHSLWGVIVTRAMAGIGEGALLGVSFSIIAHSRLTHRAFGFFGVAQTLSGIAGFQLLAWLIRAHGWTTPFWTFATIGVASLALLPWLTAITVSHNPQRHYAIRVYSIIGLASILVLFAAQSAIWPFLELIGKARGVGDPQIAAGLSLAALCGLAGSACATALSARTAGMAACWVAAAMSVVAIMGIAFGDTSRSYLIAIGGFYFAWAFFMPLQLGVLKKVDAGPRIFVLASIATSCGFAAGPAIGGLLVHGSDYSRVYMFGILGTLAATLLLFFSTGRSALGRAVADLA
ncbi:MAG: hypothetical protein GIW98_02505 [Candidatus Eremiobacteraeota bacterium]|nr:hypothetical protein [Candidatus Eremiobacteraeota bacterium]